MRLNAGGSKLGCAVSLTAFLYILAIARVLDAVQKYERHQPAYDPFRPYLSVVAYLVAFVLFGFILGGEKLVTEWRKGGRWKVDAARLLLVGVPSLLIFLAVNSWVLFRSPILDFMVDYLGPLMLRVTKIQAYLVQILLGYVLATSFSKVKEGG